MSAQTVTTSGRGPGINDIKEEHIDFGLLPNQVSAEDLPIEDTAGYYIATEVEAALAEIGERLTPERTCWVSKSFTDNNHLRVYNTVKAAITYVTSQVPTASTPWLVYIYPGLYEEERGVWIDADTESSLVPPDYCFFNGADRNTVIIKPDSNVPGEDMNLFGAILEKDKDPNSSSHIGFSNLTLADCLYGDAIQLDSFIKKPDYPEFRCYVDNVKIVNCETGLKTEERNSWAYVNDLYCENCHRGVHTDDGKIFGANWIIRQKGDPAAQLQYGIFAEDKKGKIQVFGIDIGIDWEGLDNAWEVGAYATDKAEIHAYDCRIDNAVTSVLATEGGEFKGWGIKLHDSAPHNIRLAGGDTKASRVEIFGGDMDGTIQVEDDSDLHLRDISVDAHKHDAHLLQWNSTGALEIGNATLLSKGHDAVDYRCIDFTMAPSRFMFTNSFLRYDHDNTKPDYLLYASTPISADVRNCGMEAGMNGNVVVPHTMKHVGGVVDLYSTIQDAISASVAGNLVRVNSGIYTEQITLKPDITIEGVDKDTTILTSSSNPIICPTGMSTECNIKALTIKADIGNTLCDMNGRIKFTDCIITDTGIGVGWKTKITADAQSEHTITSFIDCKLLNNFEINQALGAYFVNGITLRDCTLDGKIDCTFDRGGLNMHDCALDIAWVKITGVGGASLSIEGTTIYSEEEISVELCGTIKVFNLKNCPSVGNDLASGVKFNTVPTSCIMISNGINGGGSNPSIEVVTGISVDADTFLNNTMNNGIGGAGIFKHANSTKFVGGGVDWYGTVQHALNGIASNNQKIVLKADQTITSELTIPSYEIMIDGLHQFAITRSAGNRLMTLRANDNLKFTNIDLIGSIDVAGNAAKLFLADHTYLKGMIDIQTGNTATEIRLDQCRIVGDATHKYCIRITDVDPTIKILRSYLKGDTGEPAIYWGAGYTNNNVDIGWATIMHGSLAANSPFGRDAAQTPTISSHHNIYNTDPFAAVFTNDIAGSNDTFDPEGDF